MDNSIKIYIDMQHVLIVLYGFEKTVTIAEQYIVEPYHG